MTINNPKGILVLMNDTREIVADGFHISELSDEQIEAFEKFLDSLGVPKEGTCRMSDL